VIFSRLSATYRFFVIVNSTEINVRDRHTKEQMMIVHLNLSPELEDELHEAWGKDLERNVLEAVAAEFYRQGKCGTGTVRRMLGLEDRWDTIDFLGKRNLYPNYNEESAAQDWETIQHMKAKNAERLRLSDSK